MARARPPSPGRVELVGNHTDYNGGAVLGAAVGRLLTASHRSSQHLFENSTPALDQLVDLLEPHPKVHGARLTEGGFGGAVIALTTADFSESDAAAIATRYAAQHGRVPEVIHLQTADGAQLLR